MTISTEKVGARIYVTGNTFAVKNQLKAAGCHWDGDRKQWWIGASKAVDIASIVGSLDSQPAPNEDLAEKRVFAKVEYKNRTYYVIAEGSDRVRLTVLDGSIDLWANKSDCNLIKEYQPRQVWDGRRYSNNTVTRYTTLGSLRNFISQRKSDEATVTAGGVPDGWCIDLEDGSLKPRHECDIPAN